MRPQSSDLGGCLLAFIYCCGICAVLYIVADVIGGYWHDSSTQIEANP